MKKETTPLPSVTRPDATLRDSFAALADPGPDFRGLPFWSWNAKLSPVELRRQIRVFRDMGFGGFFMHSREGLATEYLGPDWFRCVRACANEARKCGMRAWAYDEDRWPSGAAGGIVTASPRYRNRSIVREEGTAAAWDGAAAGDALAWFAEVPAPGAAPAPEAPARHGERLADAATPPVPRIESYRSVSGPGARLRPGERLVRYRVKVADGQPRFNGGAYLDVLSRAAVREFVRVTHEAYARELGPGLSASGAVPGFFTDEPYLPDPVPWTDGLRDVFRRRFGYDVVSRLPELFSVVGGEEWSKARYDFRECATALFCDAFAGTIGAWCARRGVLFTGHVLDEDTPRRQADHVGSAMRFYEKMQAPGIDLLTERWLPVLTAKQCASAARQCGRPFRLCEAYGCTGWDFPLEGHKALGDWLLALGINHRVHHLAWYSMPGRVKRDYPASISRQSPWFRRYKNVEDYFARAGELAGQGREERDLLVLHPVESVWGRRVGWSRQPELTARDDAFAALCGDLLGRHLDFDFGDEDLLARLGRVSPRGGASLAVGKASYRAVLLPAGLETIRSATLSLLRAFARAGGAVFARGEAPARVDAKPSGDAAEAWRRDFRPAPADPDALDAALSPFARRLSLAQDGRECDTALVHERSRPDGTVYFVCNTSAPQPRSVAEMMGGAPAVRDRTAECPGAVLRVRAAGDVSVSEVDLLSGEVRPAPFARDGGFVSIPCPLGRLGSRLFAVRPAGAAPPAPGPAAPGRAPHRIRIPHTGFSYSLDEPNALVLDMAEWTLRGEPHPLAHVLDIDREARLSLGLPPREGRPVQPWALEAAARGRGPWFETGHAPEKKASAPLALRFRFRVAGGAASRCRELALERPELWRISINGKPVPSKPAVGWWIDPCVKRVAIPPRTVRAGENELVMECPAFGTGHPGLEAAFLVGVFAVRNGNRADGGVVAPLQATLREGDLAAQGLPNYGGGVTFRFRAVVPPDGPVCVAPGPWEGTAIGFRANGSPEAFRFAPPYEAVFDGGCLRRDGTDEFEITVYGSRRNQLGPFYLPGGLARPAWTGNAEMDCTAEAPRRALVPFGLFPAR